MYLVYKLLHVTCIQILVSVIFYYQKLAKFVLNHKSSWTSPSTFSQAVGAILHQQLSIITIENDGYKINLNFYMINHNTKHYFVYPFQSNNFLGFWTFYNFSCLIFLYQFDLFFHAFHQTSCFTSSSNTDKITSLIHIKYVDSGCQPSPKTNPCTSMICSWGVWPIGDHSKAIHQQNRDF